MAWRHREPRVRIDPLDLAIEPRVFAIDTNRNLAVICRRAVPRNNARLRPPARIHTALPSERFDVAVQGNTGDIGYTGPAAFEAVLFDERGKGWRLECIEARQMVVP